MAKGQTTRPLQPLQQQMVRPDPLPARQPILLPAQDQPRQRRCTSMRSIKCTASRTGCSTITTTTTAGGGPHRRWATMHIQCQRCGRRTAKDVHHAALQRASEYLSL